MHSLGDNYELRGAQISICETAAAAFSEKKTTALIKKCCAVGLNVLCNELLGSKASC